ncbi:MAG: N-acetylglucosamine-6-phosphate deacetylase [Ilumatobacteraceae bacterium]
MAELLARGLVLTPTGPVPGEVWADRGTIVEVRPAELPDGPPHWIAPGSIDLQVNGSHGVDVATAPHRIGELAARLPVEGVTAFLPTVVTGPDHRRQAALDIGTAMSVPAGAAVPLGWHLEGPAISPARRGAHPTEHLREPDAVAGERWTRARGVTMVTLAPERPGALELIAELTAAGVVVALGHTDADAAQFQAGLDAGATHVTHLFNAMRPFGHRDPGPIGVTLADETVTAGLICDLLHVDPVAIRMAWRALGPGRFVLVSDAVAARGTGPHPDGVRNADGVLAGSTLALDAAVRNLVAVTGASVADAVRTVTSTPARVLGLSDRGRLVAGARADVTVLDRQLRVVEVYVGGEPGVDAPPARTR